MVKTEPPPPGRVSPALVEASHAAYSRLWKTYLARGKVGTQRPSRSTVFQPEWSICRWVHMTMWMSSGRRPAAARWRRRPRLPLCYRFIQLHRADSAHHWHWSHEDARALGNGKARRALRRSQGAECVSE
jgi:hypothetical protein